MKNKNYWEKRSKEYGDDIKGVLMKGMPPFVNEYLHLWMTNEVKRVVPKIGALKILDIGCGYGRLTGEILKINNKAQVFGIDISKNSINLYNTKFPKAHGKVADMRDLPFKDSFFDVVISATSLMYMVSKRDQAKAFGEMFRVLKKKGRFVIIEPSPGGQLIATLGRKSNHSTNFSQKETYSKITRFGGETTETNGLTGFSFSLLFVYLISKINLALGKKFMDFTTKTASNSKLFLTFSLYISYIGVKRDD